MSLQTMIAGAQPVPATHAEAAFGRLHADILSGALKPGDRMHIGRLQKAYRVGATPLREALSKLTSLDLVTSQGQRGFRVAPVSIENLIDVTRMRATLEIAALRLALTSGDRDWEAAIVAAEHRLRGCPKLEGKTDCRAVVCLQSRVSRRAGGRGDVTATDGVSRARFTISATLSTAGWAGRISGTRHRCRAYGNHAVGPEARRRRNRSC